MFNKLVQLKNTIDPRKNLRFMQFAGAGKYFVLGEIQKFDISADFIWFISYILRVVRTVTLLGKYLSMEKSIG